MINGKLDEIDLKLLSLIQRDSRMSLVQLGTQVNLTAGPVQTRLEKLEEMGFIRRYTALLDREKIGRPVLVVLMVKMKEQNTGLLLEFENLIAQMPEVLSCYIVSGNWNFILQVTAVTPQSYAVWLLERINTHPNVGEVQSNFLLKECKSQAPFDLAAK
ncbi:MAG: Lrp/AsnC family transcriptional regulator [Bacteroidota bacterium]